MCCAVSQSQHMLQSPAESKPMNLTTTIWLPCVCARAVARDNFVGLILFFRFLFCDKMCLMCLVGHCQRLRQREKFATKFVLKRVRRRVSNYFEDSRQAALKI